MIKADAMAPHLLQEQMEKKHLLRLCELQHEALRQHPDLALRYLPGVGDRVMRLHEVLIRTGLSESTLRRLEKADKFPHRCKLSLRAVGWRASEVAQWLERNPSS